MSFNIRETQIEDLPLVNSLYASSVNDPVGVQRNDWEALLTEAFLQKNPGLSFLATTTEGEPIGHVFGGFTGRRLMIHHLYVVPSQRGRAIGSRLLYAQELAAREKSYRRMAVGIVREKKRDRFCERNGFNLKSTRPMYQFDIPIDFFGDLKTTFGIRNLQVADYSQVCAFVAKHGNGQIEIDSMFEFDRDNSFVAISSDGKVLAVLFGENSGFRGLLVDWLIQPDFYESSVADQLIEYFVHSVNNSGVKRILAAGNSNLKFQDIALLHTNFKRLDDEAIAFRKLE
jgi:GNAT superfamily N-acetyltransferase